MRFTPQDEEFRRVVRAWLADNLTGEFAAARGLGGPGREEEASDERWAWERHLAAGWTCLGWPPEHGGRGLPADPAGDLLRGVRPGARRQPGSV